MKWLKAWIRACYERTHSPEEVCKVYGHDKEFLYGGADFGHGAEWKCKRCLREDRDNQN
jgi:hypothetical protein